MPASDTFHQQRCLSAPGPFPVKCFLVRLVSVKILRFESILSLNSGMKRMNRTLLLPLLSRCQQILEETHIDIKGEQFNATLSSSTEVPLSNTSPVAAISSSRATYDNAYFYILFVMVFYSFLAMTLFKCIGGHEEKKDPYEEFMSAGQSLTQKFNKGHMTEKFYFEEESCL